MTERLTLMAVHAHPDDECMGTGGVLARYAHEGIRTVLVTATRGEEGEVVDPDIHLEVEEMHILGYRDSGMAGWETNNHPDCLAQADLDEATGRLVRLIREFRPHVITCYDEQGGYGHPDHIQVHRMTVAAFHAAGEATQYPEHGLAPWQPSKLYYTAYPRSHILTRYEIMCAMGAQVPSDRPDFDPNKVGGTPEELITTRVDTRDFLLHKMHALRCHRTQIAPDWWFTRVPHEVLRDKFGLECFTRIVSHVPVDGPEDDLFAGLR